MTQLEKFKRWAEKQGWFPVWETGNRNIVYVLPSGYTQEISYDSEGNICDLVMNIDD